MDATRRSRNWQRGWEVKLLMLSIAHSQLLANRTFSDNSCFQLPISACDAKAHERVQVVHKWSHCPDVSG